MKSVENHDSAGAAQAIDEEREAIAEFRAATESARISPAQKTRKRKK